MTMTTMTTTTTTTTTTTVTTVGGRRRVVGTRGPVRGGRDTVGPMTTTRRSALPVVELAKVDDSVYGPVLCVVAAAWVGWTFFNGAKETKEISEELQAKGYDVTDGLKLYELKFLKRTVDAGNKEDIQEAVDKIWFARAKTVAAIGDIVQVRKMSQYWKSRGVKVERLSDLDNLQDWMVAKYNNKRRE